MAQAIEQVMCCIPGTGMVDGPHCAAGQRYPSNRNPHIVCASMADESIIESDV